MQRTLSGVPMEEKAKLMAQLLDQGKTFDAVGELFGISYQRVRQIVREYTDWKRDPRQKAEMRKEAGRKQYAEHNAMARHLAESGRTPAQVADELGMTLAGARAVFKRHGIPYPKSTGLITPEEVLRELQETYLRLQRPIKYTDVPQATQQRVRGYFVTWLNACAAAGVPGTGLSRTRSDLTPDSVILEAVGRYLDQEPNPTYHGWLTWGKKNNVPGRATYRARILMREEIERRR